MNNAINEAIVKREYRVGIIGLGYVGLPLIDAFIQVGFNCLGFDIDESKADQLNRGQSYIKHVSSDKVKAWRQRGQSINGGRQA